MKLNHTIKERFLKYVQIDTEADPFSSTIPSSAKQKDLSLVLVEELKAMGVENAFTNEYGYVYATIPSNIDKEVDGIFFCSHVDTAPDVTGKNVKPIVHENYQGNDIVLPDDTSQVLTTEKYPKLLTKIGHDLITASGLTLLGSDDKSGVAIIMDAMHQLVQAGDSIKHGDVTALFTTDEEIGRGVIKVDTDLIPASFGYTLDGGGLGAFSNQNFSADGAVLTVTGVSAHPGYAKGKMQHAMKIAAEILAALPKEELSPETTSGMEGFIHPGHIEGGLETTTIKFIIRDFDTAGLAVKADLLRNIAEKAVANYPGSKFDLEIKEQYRNMHDVVAKNPHISNLALEAMKRVGVEPNEVPIRGGTDGAVLSFKGLPCPNLFAGQQAIHSRHEWTSVQDMEKATQTILHIVQLNTER